jgi:hypothetical protein
MKKLLSLSLTATLLGLACPAAVQAGEKPGKDRNMPTQRILKRFDTNGNGVIDPGPESDALRSAFAKKPKLKYLDTNNDGKLDDSEIAAIKPNRKQHKKKNQDPTPATVPISPAPAASAAPATPANPTAASGS